MTIILEMDDKTNPPFAVDSSENLNKAFCYEGNQDLSIRFEAEMTQRGWMYETCVRPAST